ncbi:MAG: acyl-CoA thioesterase [Myxococcales bacterium]|nr:acyl-CoA thioesterase [Myxococcales bacterium]
MSDHHRRHLHVPEDMPIVARVRVLYADTDAMGVVYHGSYIRYLEHARIEYLRQRGTVYAEVEAAGYAVPVTELGARYTAPARFDDVLTLRALLVVQSRARLRFAYRVSVEAGDRVGLDRPLTALVATTDHCCLNPRTGRPVPFPQGIHESLARARALVDAPSAAPADDNKT